MAVSYVLMPYVISSYFGKTYAMGCAFGVECVYGIKAFGNTAYVCLSANARHDVYLSFCDVFYQDVAIIRFFICVCQCQMQSVIVY